MADNVTQADEYPEVTRLKSEIESENASNEQIVDILNRLSKVTVSKPMLQHTKIGVVVGKLRHHTDPGIAAISSQLVDQWKATVGKNKKVEGGCDERGSSNGNDRKRVKPDYSPAESSQAQTLSCDTKYTGPMTKDEKRNRCRDLLFRAFLEGMGDDQRNMLDAENVSKLVAELEEVLHEVHIEKNSNPKEYHYQFRTIKSNLADKRNPEFNARVYLGAVPLNDLAIMPSTDMASDAKKRERQKAKKDALEACQSDWDLRNVKRAKGQFPCGKCKSEKTTYFQMQTRSSDEPMTTYVTCLNCHNRWKM